MLDAVHRARFRDQRRTANGKTRHGFPSGYAGKHFATYRRFSVTEIGRERRLSPDDYYWGDRLAGTYNESSQEAKTYRYTGGTDEEAFVEITGSATYAGTYHLVRNFQGRVIALADASGTLLESYSYTAFGKPTITDVSTGQVLTESDYGLDRLFLGWHSDAEIGLYDLRARWDYEV